MATDVRLPDLGEGIDDAIISRWLVQEGEPIKEGDPLVEIATDKVDTEMPAPASGVLLKIVADEGGLIPSGALLGYIGEAGEEIPTVSDVDSAPASTPETESEPVEAETIAAQETDAQVVASNEQVADLNASPVAKRVAADKGIALDSVTGTGMGGRITKGDVLSAKAAPLSESGNGYVLPGDLADSPSLVVKRLAAINNVNLEEIADGRPLSSLTRYDVMSAVESRKEGEPVTVEPTYAPPAGWSQATAAPAKESSSKPAPAATPAPVKAGPDEELVAHTRMRSLIAKNMVDSAFTAPHVTTMWDVNMSAVLADRKAHKAEFQAQGVNLTVTAYLAMATVAALKAVPAANAKYTDEGVLLRRTINLGMAVALPADEHGLGGLIVPVIKNAGDLNLMGMARAVNDIANRSRNNQLTPDDLQGSTFTLTNYGTSGSKFQTPIIAQGQAGILGVGAIEKRPVVVSNGHPLEPNMGDYLAFPPMTTLGFSYDHRVLDGATADAYCSAVKQALEEWQ